MKKSEHMPAEAMHSWVQRLNEMWGTDVDAEAETDLILNMVRDVGGLTARAVGPLTAYMMGMAVGRAVPHGHSHQEFLAEYASAAVSIAEELGTSVLDEVEK